MWRSIAGRPSVTRYLGRRLLSLRNQPTQVLFKPPNSSLSVSNLLPRKSPHQNHRFFSHSSKLDDLLVLLENNEDESLESSLDSMNLCLDEGFVLGLLKHRSFPLKHLGRFFKWVCSKKEFRVTPSILGELQMHMLGSKTTRYVQKVDVGVLWELVKEIGEKENGLLNNETLNNFLLAFCLWRNEKGVLEVYGKFEEFGCIPDGTTYYYTIQMLCETKAYDLAISFCQKMINTAMIPEHSHEVSEILSLLCEGNRAKEAHDVYVAAKNSILYNVNEVFLLSGLVEVVYYLTKVDETVHLAKEILLHCDIPAEDRRELHDPFLWVIRGSCRKKDIESAKKLLFEMIAEGPPPRSEVFDCLIESLSRAGDLEDAREILKLAETRGLTPTIFSYNDVIDGYAKVGSMEEARKVLLAAKKKHTKLLPDSLYTLIREYWKLGEFDKALKLFSEMNNFGVEPSAIEYNKLIKSLKLCLKGDLERETAQKLLEQIREKGLYIPHITEALIRAV